MAVHYLYQVHDRIRRRKGSGGFEVSPIEWPDIWSYLQATRTRLDPWEISAVERLDDAFLAAVRKARSE